MTEPIDTSQFDAGGPIEVAAEWFRAVLERGDLAAGWPLMDIGLRQRTVEAFLRGNCSHPSSAQESPEDLREATAEALSTDNASQHPLWEKFAAAQVAHYREMASHINLENAGFVSGPRVLGLDLELLLLVDTGTPGPVVIEKPTLLPALGFVVRRTDGGWLINDFQIPQDGGGSN